MKRVLGPVTSAEIESYLDFVARLMDRAGNDAELFLPIWRRLEREIAKLQERDTVLAAARARLTRSSGQTAAP